MLGDKIKVQSKVVSDYTDEQLLFIKQMGVNIAGDGDGTVSQRF